MAITPVWSVDLEDVDTITSTGLFVMTTTTSDTYGDAIVASVGPTNGYATVVRNTSPPSFVPLPSPVHD